MLGTLEITDNTVFSEFAVRQALGLSPSEMAEARRRGELRSRQVGKRHFYTGQQLMSWLEAPGLNRADPVPSEQPGTQNDPGLTARVASQVPGVSAALSKGGLETIPADNTGEESLRGNYSRRRHA